MPAGPSTHLSLLGRLEDHEDGAAWFDFHRKYAELIIRVSRAHRMQAADCDDVLQEVLVELTRSTRNFRPERGRFRSYLQTIVKRAIYRRFRQTAQQTAQSSLEGAAETPPVEDAIWEVEWRKHHIRRAMETIETEFSETNRLAFMHMTASARTAQETADLLGISTDQAYQAKSRIIKRLAEIIEQQIEVEG